jgi:hypothetical protein
MPLLRRRPLLRAAAVGGGAYYAGTRRANTREREAGQEQRIEDLEDQSRSQPAAAPPETGVSATALAQLKQLGELHDQGVLTDEEFTEQKQRCLGTASP